MEEYLTILQNYFKEIKDFGNKMELLYNLINIKVG